MTAGSGVFHSEHNLSKTNPLRFIQIWISTRQRGLRPNYGQYLSLDADRGNKWAHLVTDVKQEQAAVPIKINADANIFVTEINAGDSVPYTVAAGRQAYVLLVEGGGSLTDGASAPIALDRHEAAEVRGPVTLTAASSAEAKSHWLMVEMALDASSGRKDL